MRDKLLKRKLNPFLLVTTVMVLAILAGLSVMYQQELGELVGTKDNLSTQLKDTEAELEQAQQNITRLRDTRDRLNSEISNLSTTLENVRESKNSEISGLEDDLQQARNERDSWRERFEETNSSLEQVKTERDELLFSLELVCSDLNESASSFEECEARGFS
ncbi:hypothetical protein ACK3SF_04610 [Candidatus Nanosalina sp. VS9-1]|uniref:hypothetical protein n=1 Tax=Candidatus Nanosalina sp. VS9-1 TaxID=3388566 RepID=UPI0039E19787